VKDDGAPERAPERRRIESSQVPFSHLTANQGLRAVSTQEQQYLFSVLPLKRQLQETEGKLLEELKLFACPGAVLLSRIFFLAIMAQGHSEG
jgi:hypothetical protein